MIDYSRYRDGTELNWYESDFAMKRYTERYLSAAVRKWGEERLQEMGAYAAGPMEERARHTDREGAPRLLRYDRYGQEINEVWVNEGYKRTLAKGYGSGVVGWRYRQDVPESIPFFYTQLLHMLMSKAEVGFTCPTTLTMSVAFVLEKFGSAEQRERYLPRLASMDPAMLEEGATFLTEIQGGSDVGATATRAVAAGNHYLLTGEKWFASNCAAGLAITLAREGDTPGTKGLSLFLLPRILENGEKNRVTIRRLKDKLGVRAVPSGELELKEATAYRIGEPERGFQYMAEALNISRMCTATGSLALSQRAFVEAVIYTAKRTAFGNRLDRYPLVRQTLLDMVTDIELGWALAAQMIRAMDDCHTYHEETEENRIMVRLLLAMAKYRLSENGVRHAKESLELHGGNGYIEEFVPARLLRDAQVNTVWEGPSNIMALEIVKSLERETKRTGGDRFVWQQRVEEALSQVTAPELAEAVETVQQESNRVSRDAEVLLSSNPVIQNAHARRFADRLIDVCSITFLLEEAQYDRDVRTSGRLAQVARYAVWRTYQPAAFDIGAAVTPSVEWFDSIVLYQE
ncbi:acyl-CoA dehydrogenase family protein [Desmospora activa]|uniref:Alkylation response protein AidB-like acyl-CoA dehydrogenase n=1 Tax=Desmospora activa DSM 45169 TaxID=1121389 RepID=A0A2T4ZC13_9BACL|nr:acyl-CoA dehydrogenase family protein [Desmospora activa]PTM59409.1 alkylation response protein AidB-like acyl-CoA dehydrogenase [Desmospora activa DSM 45169]